VTALLGVAAYGLLLAWALLWSAAGLTQTPLPGAAERPVLSLLLVANALLLLNRSLHRAVAVHVLYGAPQALVSIPRQVWGNVINFRAACHALLRFRSHRRTGAALIWDKTRHAFPS